MGIRLARVYARGESLSDRMRSLDESNLKIKQCIALAKAKDARLEDESLSAERCLSELVTSIGKRKRDE